MILTNTVPVDAYRGYGRPEAAYIAERTIEAVAHHLDLDPVEVRRINFVRAPIFRIALRQPAVIYDSGDYEGCLDKAMAAFDYAAARAASATLAREGPLSRHWRRRLHRDVRHGAVAPARRRAASTAAAGRARASAIDFERPGDVCIPAR